MGCLIQILVLSFDFLINLWILTLQISLRNLKNFKVVFHKIYFIPNKSFMLQNNLTYRLLSLKMKHILWIYFKKSSINYYFSLNALTLNIADFLDVINIRFVCKYINHYSSLLFCFSVFSFAFSKTANLGFTSLADVKAFKTQWRIQVKILRLLTQYTGETWKWFSPINL